MPFNKLPGLRLESLVNERCFRIVNIFLPVSFDCAKGDGVKTAENFVALMEGFLQAKDEILRNSPQRPGDIDPADSGIICCFSDYFAKTSLK